MYINKFWKNTLGLPAHVLVAGPVEYSAQATIDAFNTSAAVNEFGFYNADTGALISGLAAVGATVRIFGVVKRANNKTGALSLHKTPVFTVGELTKKQRTAYAAPANSVRTSGTWAAPVAGTVYELSILDRTPGAENFPTYTYNVVAAAGETATSLIDKFVTKINTANSFENKNTDPIVTASRAASTLVLTGNAPYVKFKVQYRQGLAGVTDTQTTAASLGNGYYEHVAAMEALSLVGQGVTTNYPNLAVPDEYGKPVSAITSANQFNIYELEVPRKGKTQGPNSWENSLYIILAIANNGAANPEAEVKTILGL